MQRFCPQFLVATMLAVLCLPPMKPLQAGTCSLFRRGDANADGSVDIADGVWTLVFLFAGGNEPPCMDAADTDDSGDVQLTDATVTFNYAFRRGAPPALPGPFDCGLDSSPAFDELFCESYEACDPRPPEGRDFSAFERYTYVQLPGFGFCPREDSIFSASIRRLADGRYEALFTTREAEVEFDSVCFDGLLNGDVTPACRATELPLVELIENEVQELIALYAEVELHPEPEQFCACAVVDPCLVALHTWDDVEVSEFICDAPRLAGPQAEELVAFLDRLASGGE